MKDLKISTELASAVLGKEVTKCSLINKARNSINITYFEDKEDFNAICREWNIYEFAFKCKEWALAQNYSMLSLPTKDGGKCEFYLKSVNSIKDKVQRDKSEVESIIKACSCILESLSETI